MKSISVYHGSGFPDFKGESFISPRYKACVLFGTNKIELAKVYQKFHNGYLYKIEIPIPKLIIDYNAYTYYMLFNKLVRDIINKNISPAMIKNCIDGPSQGNIIMTPSDIYVITDFSQILSVTKL